MERMDRLLRKKELVEAVGVAKSTIADWVIEFHMYIPTVKQGAVTYYRPEAIDVLNVIKELRQLDYAKPQILGLLAQRGFPITVEEASEDLQRLVSQADARDTLLNVMQTMGLAVAEIGKQTERLNRHEEQFDRQNERLDGQDGRIIEHENRLQEQDGKMVEMIRTMQQLQEELAATKEELREVKQKKGFLRKLFGKN